ncbi:hypothetical protein [Nesterenkonia sp. HG001]|uniref:glycosyltransferase n=1 Tax=Nesterenkonia sp. HG001 TaxID=2983207 RepID=UPI002AC45DB9|nr:hypothetical protein [Nesterenkonia sp. HG001]MDZ5076983.1 hypothetical protein [Nesterenkonia sp. HG001]
MIHKQVVEVIHMSDFRLPGGTSHSVAEEVRAQAAAGMPSYLLHAPSDLVGKVAGWSPPIRSLLDLPHVRMLSPRAEVHARTVVVRHPTVVQTTPATFKGITADRVIMVANNAAVDNRGDYHYDVAEVDSKLTRMFGVRPTWAPIGPVVRETIAEQRVEVDLMQDNWFNVLDLGEVDSGRSGFVGDVPVIGRHSRPQAAKWPSTKREILAAYPRGDDFQVEILGGAQVVRSVIGWVPNSWNVINFGGESPEAFLRRIDFWVYFHHEDLREAYGRAIMEALAAGAVVILPEYLRETYGDAALYSTPAKVQDLVRSLYAAPQDYLAQSRRGQEFVKNFQPRMHVERMSALGVRSVEPGSESPSAPTPHLRWKPKKRVLFLTSNGAGMGHLTRLLSVATRLEGQAEPIFASLSMGAPVVAQYGIPFEYIGSSGAMSMETSPWNDLFKERFKRLLDDVQPDAFVFDGTWPYKGLMAVLRHRPVEKIWMRRAMWRPEVPGKQLDHAKFFDLIIEPGEFASDYDRGMTTNLTDAARVAPITLLSGDDVLSRTSARDELGYGQDDRVVLITLGAGNINDIGGLQSALLNWFTNNAPGWRVVMTKPPIAQGDSIHDIETLQVYPLARYTKAFDVAVSAAGYNAFHEWVAGDLPTLWVPNEATMTDDQVARVRWAADAGVGAQLESEDVNSVARALELMTQDSTLDLMREKLAALPKVNGAVEAARMIMGKRESL